MKPKISKPPKWKKAGPNGEKEIIFPTGRRFKIEKQLDENERHKGEWKVMEWDKRSRDWEWHETYSPQWYAKEKVMQMGQYDIKGKKVSIYEEASPATSIGNASVALPPTARFKTINVTDRRRRKDKEPLLLKRFRKYMEDNRDA